ncbi:MAG TPA: hypothetical protein VG406_23450 [Isosphaeraceae bacterium]|jgi:hypothetical protein|nr:hypothetical protein [Isosphaeraceae bacterium]
MRLTLNGSFIVPPPAVARVVPPGVATTFRLDARAVAPPPGLDEARSRAFWRLVRDVALAVKDRELAAGLDKDGRELAAVRPRRPRYRSGRRLDGPPLMPHRALSRTRRLLRGRADARGVTFSWARGWGRILGYHAAGQVRGAPDRDVIGLSRAGRALVAATALRRWAGKYGPPRTPALDLPRDLAAPAPSAGSGRFVVRAIDAVGRHVERLSPGRAAAVKSHSGWGQVTRSRDSADRGIRNADFGS